MAKLTPIERLHDDIMKILDEYTDDVDRKSEECVKKVAQKGALALRHNSPRKSGKYADGWTYKVQKTRLETNAVIYNAARPGLAHLLEHGHATRNGDGRRYDDTPAHVHIAPIEEQIAEDFEKTIKVDLSK